MLPIAIIGHPSSAQNIVLQLLIRNGVQEAQPSRREHMSVAEIHAALCRAYGCAPLISTAPNGLLSPVQPGPVWNELMLDLLLANRMHTWAWADPQAIHLVEHWLAQEPQARFLLVYGRPSTAFLAEDDEYADLTSDDVAKRWCAFNTTLLHVAQSHPQRCLLVGLNTDWTSPGSSHTALAAELLSLLGLPLWTEGSDRPGSPPDAATDRIHATGNLLAATLAERYPMMDELYGQLQKAATLPLPDPPDITAQELHGLCRLLSEGTLSTRPRSMLDEVRQLQEENVSLQRQLHLVQEKLEHYLLQHKALEAQRKSGSANSPRRGIKAATYALWSAPSTRWGQAGRVLERLKALQQARRLRRSKLFDSTWYLRQNPDIAAVKAFARNPALHYLIHGAAEGRDPSSRFSGAAYLQQNPDVRGKGMNPLLHYICHGQAEGRSLGL